MASPICEYLVYYESLAYLIPRLLIWLALFGLAITDGILHRHIKKRGWQLHRGICVVIGAFVVQDVLLLTYSIGARSNLGTVDGVCKAFIFFSDLADSLFIVSDYISNSSYALDDNANLVESINLGTPHAHPAIPSALLFLQLVSLIALLLAWVYIFDTVQRERELLEGPKEGIIGAGGLQDPSQVAHTTTVFPPDRADSSKAKDEEAGEMSGQAVNIPPQMLVDSADGRSIGDMYAPMQDQDTDKPKTIEDQMQLRSKVRLMKQFQWGVAAYVAAKAAVILLPALVWVEPGDAAIKTIYILQNCVRWIFLAALPQEDNPYLLLEEGADNPSTEMHTELGLVHSDSHADLEAGRGNESPVSIDRNFSIGDLDDEEDVSAKPAPSPPSPRRQNKNLSPNRLASGQLENGDTSSQSSSPKHSRPVPPPKPSGKKD
ncbi:hypothetical protein MMC08_000714 [Hypocenomyce scalaris]|nr:hypothetical protein [Hypocenomyce scalaris]